MDLGTVMSVAQTLFAALQCKELKDMCSFLGYKVKLDELQRTVSTIQAVFRDADNKEDELSHQAQLWIQELKDAVFDADDLFDEFLTLAKQKELIKGGKPSKEVNFFFSRYNPVKVAYKMSQGVNKIRKNLDAITKDHEQLGFKLNCEPIRKRPKETCSYVYDNNIIGREKDVEKILDHMLDESNIKQDVSFLSIVGIGGLGKTALAQLLYNHPSVTSAFPLKMWTCVSDHDQPQLDAEPIIRKIFTVATGQNHDESTLEILQNKLREKLTSNKYLLVLDDVWTENRNHWLELVQFFMGGQRGSWIVVTTRSHETAKIVGGALAHELQGLSKENSWKLFKYIAFGQQQSNPPENLVKIGEEIVEGCARVPLAIRVAGSLLYGKKENEWISFKEIGLSKHTKGQKDIIPILMLSYNKLEYELKSCFTYCALFPKDTVIEKELLISLWLANDFVAPLSDGQSIEDAAEEYYSILLRRCFFQDVELDLYGEIVSCKTHDLMHDVAQKVAGNEISMLDVATDDVLKKSRHLAYMYRCCPNSFISNTCIRSYLYGGTLLFKNYEIDQVSLKALLTNWKCLRVLDLHGLSIKSLPESIGEMLHLRYLNLSWNDDLEVLPKSITKLYNLQTLKLVYCNGLKELPKDLRKLVNLRILNILWCNGLTNMPEGMSELTHLLVLSKFVIDGSKLSEQQWLNQLGELGKLNRLKGELEVRIKVCGKAKEVTNEDGEREGAYLRGKQHLNCLTIRVDGEGNDEGKARLLEQLQPHPNLKDLWLDGKNNIRMPEWGNNLATCLPHLINLEIQHIDVQNVMCLGYLRHLKDLRLERLMNLEYMYEEDSAVARSSDEATTSMPHNNNNNGLPTAKGLHILYPCLEQLRLCDLPKLKGWRNSRVGMTDNQHQQVDTTTTANITQQQQQQLSLPLLKFLTVSSCPDLICTLMCPNLEDLHLEKFNKKLKVIAVDVDDDKTKASAPTSSSSSHVFSKLSRMIIDDVSWLNSFPREAFHCVTKLTIYGGELKSLGEAEEVFRDRLSSLQKLEIYDCPNLKSVWGGGLEHLINLQELQFLGSPNVSLLGDKDTTGDNNSMGLKSLRKLSLECASQLADVDHWVPFLVSLQSLTIASCAGLESLPNWMAKLSFLTELFLYACSASLKERCQRNTGQDWPYIQHIPSIHII